MQNWNTALWRQAKRALRFLKDTADLGLVFRRVGDNGAMQLQAYCDASHADDPERHRSTLGWVVLLNDTPIMWGSKLTSHTPLSTAETELCALTECTKSVLWARGFLEDIGFPQKTPTTIWEDNVAAQQLANSGRISNRTKHIASRTHFVHHHVTNGDIEVKRVTLGQHCGASG